MASLSVPSIFSEMNKSPPTMTIHFPGIIAAAPVIPTIITTMQRLAFREIKLFWPPNWVFTLMIPDDGLRETMQNLCKD